MPSNNLTIRYSKMSAVGETVAGTDLLLVGQPDATNPKTGYGVYKTTVADLTEHFKSIFRAGGLKDIIQIGPGIKGDGSPGSLELDEEYFDNLAIRTDKLSLSYVGDRAFPVLPIGGSYFAINYPYDRREQASVAYLETNGDVLTLNPVTNGFEKRYVYTTIRGWATGTWRAEPSDTVYQPPGLNPGEFVTAIFPTSETAMIIEISTKEREAFDYAVVLLNGTLSYQYHTLIRTGLNIPAWLNDDPNRSPQVLQDRPPVAYERNGKIIIAGALMKPTINGVTVKFAEVNRTTGAVTQINSVRLDCRTKSENRDDGLAVVSDRFYTTESPAPHAELIVSANPSASSSTAAAGGNAFKSLVLCFCQSKHGVRLALKRADTMNYTEDGATVPYFYVFTTVYDIYEDRSLFGADIYMREVDKTMNDRHQVTFSLTSADFTGGYTRDRGPTSSAQAPLQMFLGDGSIFMAMASTSSDTRSIPYLYRAKPGMDAWSAAYNIREPASSPHSIATVAGSFNFIISSLTPVIARGTCNYLAANMAEQGNGIAGTTITMSGSLAAESKIPAFARIKGQPLDNQYELMDYGSVKGYTLNNDRGTMPTIPRFPIVSWKSNIDVIRHSPNFFTSLQSTANDLTLDFEITHDYQVISRITLPASVRSKLIADIRERFETGNRIVTYRFACLPGDIQRRAVFVVTGADNENGQSFRTWGIFRYDATVENNVWTITGIDMLGAQSHRTNSTNVYGWSYGATQAMMCGWSALELQDGSLEFLVKEGTISMAKNGAGGGTSGCYYMRQNLDLSVEMIRNVPSLDSTSSVNWPTIGPLNMGLATIDATAGYGTNYVVRPVNPTGNKDLDKGILLISPTPSQTFTINIGGDIPVLLNGALGVIPGQSIDLANYSSGSPANKTFYFYAVEINKEVHFEILTSPMNETLSRTLFAVAKTNDEVVTNVKANPFSRLGLYRLSVSPQGSSVPFTQGSYANYVDRFWLTRWYGGTDTDWNDYFIKPTVIEGPAYQTLTLAPGARLEIFLISAGAGGGGSQYMGAPYDPTMDGGRPEESSVWLGNAKIGELPPAYGGTAGWWGFANGLGGQGGDAVFTQPSGGTKIVVESWRLAHGGNGQGGWSGSSAGGVQGSIAPPLPSDIPDLSQYGQGGDGAPDIGDGLSYGGGGGAGGSIYLILRNDGTAPEQVSIVIGEPGVGGFSAINGLDGKMGAVWYRQLV